MKVTLEWDVQVSGLSEGEKRELNERIGFCITEVKYTIEQEALNHYVHDEVPDDDDVHVTISKREDNAYYMNAYPQEKAWPFAVVGRGPVWFGDGDFSVVRDERGSLEVWM